MSTLGGVGSGSIGVIYTANIATMSMPAMTAGGVIEVTGSRRSLSVNSIKNVTPVANNDLGLIVVYGGFSCMVATNSTDTYVIKLQYSSDGGSTWNGLDQCSNIPATQNGKSVHWSYSTGSTGGVPITYPITGNVILLRMAITDATDPSTDIFTITNFNAQYKLLID